MRYNNNNIFLQIMIFEIIYSLFDFLCHILNMYACHADLYLYCAEEIIFYHLLSLLIITEKDDFFYLLIFLLRIFSCFILYAHFEFTNIVICCMILFTIATFQNS